ncbi:peptidase inhibitor family I36 protein [Actinoplanes sp. CA-054009]
MTRVLRVLAAVAAFVLAFAVGTPLAQAAPLTAARPMQLNEAMTPVGGQWLQLLPSGDLVTMQKVESGVSKSVPGVRRAAGVCPPNIYLCLFEGEDLTGTMWALNLNDIYVGSANGVAHCWNLSSAYNNKTVSWENNSKDRAAYLNNWVNCRGEHLLILRNSTQTCSGDWCTTLFPTSVKAT